MFKMTLPKTYIRVPEHVQSSRLRRLLWVLTGAMRMPVYWLMASFHATPGLAFKAKCFALGLRLLFAPRTRRSPKIALQLMLFPMDSTRHFEFEFAATAVARLEIRRYLDVSSPRIVPVAVAIDRPDLECELINPDPKDLGHTRELVNAAGVADRCRLHNKLIADTAFERGSFDAVTCISVLEHIPADTEAVRKMWELLKPGGTLVLTVPVMAQACEQYIDYDEYELLQRDTQGFVFWQRFYDARLLEERVFSVTGTPVTTVVYGEKVAGCFARDAERKRRGHGYPFWREPYMMATEYRFFDTLEALPGDGVIGMTFVKR
jgi:SAM-dependent methyltransferase